MTTIKKIFKVKNVLFASLLLLLICLVSIGLLDPFFVQKPQTSGINDVLGEVSFYPGEKDTAIMILSSENGNLSHKPLLRELLKNNYPVLVTHHSAEYDLDAENRRDLVEQQSQLLEEYSHIPPENQIWIGAQDGADDLLDQVVLGSVSAKGAALISPSFAPGLIDDAIIQNGNYQNKSDWINTLSPEMVRQPLFLLTSNRDDIASPYQMTLLYNKFSTDEIIHVGGVYQAKKNNVSLSIIDSSFHPAILGHTETLSKLESFMNELGEDISFSAVPRIRGILLSASLILLCAFLVSVYMIAPKYAPEVSYGPVSSLHLEHKGKLFTVLILSWVIAFVTAFPLWFLFKKLAYPMVFAFGAMMLIFFCCNLLFFKLFSLKHPRSFQTVSLSGKSLLSSIGLIAVSVLFFAVMLISGTISTQKVRPFFMLVMIIPAALSFAYLITVDEQLQQDESSPAIRTAFYAICLVPMLLLFVMVHIFLGSTAGFYALILMGLFIIHYLMAASIFIFSGHMLLSAGLSALSMSIFSVLFYVH